MSSKKNEVIENDESLMEEMPTEKKGFTVWISNHKRQLILAGVSVSSIIAVGLGAKNKDAITALGNQLIEEIKKPNPYSRKWFESLSEEDWHSEREKVRQAYCSSGDDPRAANILQNLLWQFDNEKNKRTCGDEIPQGPAIHREHGWYLQNDD